MLQKAVTRVNNNMMSNSLRAFSIANKAGQFRQESDTFGPI
jgi:hypothetical protein